MTLKDRLEYGGIAVGDVTPRNVIRSAFAAKLIDDAEVWIDMLIDRNMMSHTYDFAKFEEVLGNVRNRYLAVLGDLIRAIRPGGDGMTRAHDMPDATREKMNRVFAAYPELTAVTLFGSRATGKATPRSDFDLVTHGIADHYRLGRLVLDLEDLDIPQMCDVQAYEEIKYAPLKRHIDDVGVTIYRRRQ